MIFGTVAIIGRPNVGKSTLFNRLTRSSASIVDDTPGVTRDRIYGTVQYDKKKPEGGFTLIDTGGFETDDFKFQPFSENLVWQQTEQAVAEADLIIFLLDGKHGLHQHDRLMLQKLANIDKQILFVVNKIDGLEQETLKWEFYGLGVEKLHGISAAHSKGLLDLLAEIKDHLARIPGARKQADLTEGTKIALIGKPNAGKSSILNRLIGEDRSLVSPVAGTTRDSIDTSFTYNKKPYVLIDTAGIRRRTKVKEYLEVQSVVRSLRAIDRADVVVVIIDATEGITDQDARLINLAADRFKPMLLVVNKWDLVEDKNSQTAQNYVNNIREMYLKDLAYLPVHFTSCLENKRVHQIMSKVETLVAEGSRQVPTSKVNESLQSMVARHSPQIIKKYSKRLKFYYATQVRHKPPTIVVMCNVANEIQDSYKRYMLKCFRKDLAFEHVPVRMFLRGKKEVKSRKERVES